MLDERASFWPHLLELRGGVDQEVEPGPDIVAGDEVEIPFQEGRDVSVTMTRSRSLHSSASPRATEPKTIAFLAFVKWGARFRFSASRSRMMTALMTRILPEECRYRAIAY